MIRAFYPLPVEEKGCTCVFLAHCDVANLAARCLPGTATITDGVVDGDSFVADPLIPSRTVQVENRAAFFAWYDAHEKDPGDNPVQQFVSGLLYYLNLQRLGLLPNE